jgi:YVTN family beta-propeller protein
MNSSSVFRILKWTLFGAALFAPAGLLIARPPDSTSTLSTQMRRPVALALGDGGKTLFVANQRSGSISVIDTAARKVMTETRAGQNLDDVAALPAGQHLLAIDETADELLLIDVRDRLMRVVDRIKVSPDPIRLVVSAEGSFSVVASRWSRRLTFVGLARAASADSDPVLAIIGTVELPFSPRELAFVADGTRLIVADAFGGRLAVIDTMRRAIESVRSLPAHNMRGLAVAPDGQTLVVSHQVLNRNARASFDDVHWGDLIRNHLRVLRTDTLLKPDAPLVEGGRLFDLGDVGYAAGDPGAVTYDARGRVLIALTGVDEVGITASPDQGPRRVVVGRQPSALMPSPDGLWAYVANALDDTISVIEITTGLSAATISLGPRPELTAADRGERLFSSARLSHDGWMSCQSCHTDGHTNSLATDTLGDGSYGAAKRIPSLLGVAATAPWTWTGSVSRLEDQIRKSITTTMYGTKPTNEQVADLTAFVCSLPPPTASRTAIDFGDPAAMARGRGIFEARKCADCHVPPEYTSPERYDVGLADEVGNHEFNPPSLRGLSRRDTLLHDGRARSIEVVFQKEHHPRRLELRSREIADLVAFLKTL